MTSALNIAVHALVYLNHRQKNLSSEELSANICTNAARVRKVMGQLRSAGLIHTKEGVDGGYQFSMPPDQVNLRMVCEAVGVCFAKTSWKSGDTDMDCMIASGMAAVMDDIYRELDDVCKSHLEQITIADIDGRIFIHSGSGTDNA